MSKELIGSHSVHETLVRQTQIDAARIEELERERDNAEQERAQFEQESDQLREHVTMLRDALLTCSVGDFSTGHVIPPSFDEKLVEEALAATEQKP